MLTNQEILRKVRNSFKPLDCVAEIFDYEHKLRFRVYKKKGAPILTMKELLLDDLREPQYLDFILEQAIERVRELLASSREMCG